MPVVGDLVLTTNAFTNNHPAIATGGGGLTLSNSGTSGNATMTIDDNTFRDALTPVFSSSRPDNASAPTPGATFTNNDVGVAAAANSGSAEGSG